MLQWNFNLGTDVSSLRLDQIDLADDLYIYHHLGLGDMIHCNGIVRHLLSRLHPTSRVYVFSKERNAEMTRWMYRDEPRIEVLPLNAGQRERPQVQRMLRQRGTRNYVSVGHRDLRPFMRDYPSVFFDELFYMQVGLPYSIRYSCCYWERDYAEEERVYQKLAPRVPYAFVHDDPGRGYVIDTQSIPLSIVRNDLTESIFHLGLLLERATEVHCMESSIRCLIESLAMGDTKLWYHNFRYPDRPLGKATQQRWLQIDRTSNHPTMASCARN